jgi:hypothetical protein
MLAQAMARGTETRAGSARSLLIAAVRMAAAGYDPAALVDYIGAKYSALPPRAQRISGLEAAIANESFRAGEPCGEP